MKIRSGGMYLVNFGQVYDPKLKDPHYCVIMKTHDRDLFLCLPTTSKNKNDKYLYIIPEDNSKCLFKHARIISKKRILKPLINQHGQEVILSNQTLNKLIICFQKFIKDTCDNALIGNKMYHESLQNI